MLRDTVMEWTREWTREGEVKMLVRLLESKFGGLRVDDRERIEAADAERLLDWGERVLTAKSLSDVFGDS
jgi:hypothetical protein